MFRVIFLCEISYESVYCNCHNNNRKWFILVYLPLLMGEDKGGVRNKVNTER